MRFSSPESISSSTSWFLFSMPESASSVGGAFSSERTSGLDQHSYGVPDLEAVREPPGEDLPREVVDHGVKVHPGSVEEAHDRGIDVPDQVRLRGSNPDLGSIRMDPQARTAPSPHPDEPMPGRGAREDARQPLSEDREPPRGDVPVFG